MLTRGPRAFRWSRPGDTLVSNEIDGPQHVRPAGHVAEPCGVGAVAVHLGWRRMGEEGDERLRVAVVLGQDGKRQELALDRAMLAGLRVPDGIEAVRDKHFDRFRPLLVEALRAPGVTEALPERMREEARTLYAWRSPDRLREFVWRWLRAGAPGGDVPCPGEGGAAAWRALSPAGARSVPSGDSLRDAAHAWAHHDRHLLDYAANQRTSSRRARRELYRVFAAGLARRYGVLVLDDADRAELARVPKGDPEADQTATAARSNRVLAAVYSLEDALKNAFRARGGDVVEVPAPYETVTCHPCGARTAFDRSRVVGRCEACGAAWDQDDNAARNMLVAYSSTPRAATPASAASAAPKESRWAKAKTRAAAKNAS